MPKESEHKTCFPHCVKLDDNRSHTYSLCVYDVSVWMFGCGWACMYVFVCVCLVMQCVNCVPHNSMWNIVASHLFLPIGLIGPTAYFQGGYFPGNQPTGYMSCGPWKRVATLLLLPALRAAGLCIGLGQLPINTMQRNWQCNVV